MLRLILLAVSILLSNCAFAQGEIILKLTQQCDDGSVSSCAQLGDLYHQRSIQEHIALCDQGELEYCKMLGRLYVYGSGVDQDYGVAFKYFLKGCVLRKDTNSFCNSNNKVNPSDISVDLKRIADHWKKLCDDSDSLSCVLLGLSYQYGYGVRQDTNIAFNYFLNHCDKNEVISCSQLGNAYYYGYAEIFGVNLTFGDRKDAYLFYEKACQQNDSKGCYQLVSVHPKDQKSKNLVLYQKSCKLGYGDACLVLGATYLGNHHTYLKVKPNKKEAQDYFEKACNATQSQNCMGTLYMKNTGNHNEHSSEQYFDFLQDLCLSQQVEGFCDYIWHQ